MDQKYSLFAREGKEHLISFLPTRFWEKRRYKSAPDNRDGKQDPDEESWKRNIPEKRRGTLYLGIGDTATIHDHADEHDCETARLRTKDEDEVRKKKKKERGDDTYMTMTMKGMNRRDTKDNEKEKRKGKEKRETGKKQHYQTATSSSNNKRRSGGGDGGGGHSASDGDDVCVYAPRTCADPRCGALAVEVVVVKACAASSSSSSPSSVSSASRGGNGGGSGGRGRDPSASLDAHGEQKHAHAQDCRSSLLAALRRKDELDIPAPPFSHHHRGGDANNNGTSEFPHLASSPRPCPTSSPSSTKGVMSKMTPVLSSRLINADLPKPLASFSSPLFPCAPWGTKKWERHSAGRRGATRFGDREGRFSRGFGTVWWAFEGSGDGICDEEDGEEEEEEEEGGVEEHGEERYHARGGSKIVAGPGAKPRKKKHQKGEHIRRSTLANADSADAAGTPLLLYCSEHLGRQYPTFSDKELQRIREFWGSLGSLQGVTGGDDAGGSQCHGKRGRGEKEHGMSREWSREMEAKLPGYWSGLVERGLAFIP